MEYEKRVYVEFRVERPTKSSVLSRPRYQWKKWRKKAVELETATEMIDMLEGRYPEWEFRLSLSLDKERKQS